ncbi:hypothetical protein [Aliiroseovarius sp. PrR006]|uniref:hypothetical protein n=1 Tax=Aliiroseovarius sp. PrR006 TaxID=2706883 RepID=UPI0013D0EC16|nr:hypothetical protein [Aliiroseovarius sp. PrR006]NDW51816.1 hypothetical protein [Aliiroseovarius sp. PrR006]
MASEKICGIVMPISECDNLGSAHWSDVRKIVEAAATEAGYEARLVSDTFESNLIHKEILQNIYNDDLIICDVSGRNPNVFFELGIRMATQKPTVIIKDDVTAYPFDTGPNRYIQYPRDLRHPIMEKFKQDLVGSIRKTAEQPKESSFIGQLGPFHVPDVESSSIPAADAILERLNYLDRAMNKLGNTVTRERQFLAPKRTPVFVETFSPSSDELNLLLQGFSHRLTEEVKEVIIQRIKPDAIEVLELQHDVYEIRITGKNLASPKTEGLLKKIADSFKDMAELID